MALTPIEDFLVQSTEYLVSLGSKRAAALTGEEYAPVVEAIAKEKGLEDWGPKVISYLKTPEGYAFDKEMTERLWLERERLEEARRRRRPPVRVEALTEEEKRRIIEDFERIMEREPTEVEKFELFTQELKLKRRGVKT